ncbi:MAG TPA: MEDS domain-containing protein [Chthoniobacterales bacterium]|nr:MEDS domain-containing protein [Chthoniobacterales bacterium]
MIKLKDALSSATTSPTSTSRLLGPGLVKRTELPAQAGNHERPRRGNGQSQELRKTGLPAVGDVPWGSHFCIFYETRRDFRDILVPYFKAGLENNEVCISYVGSHEFLTLNDARSALRKKLPGFDRLVKEGRIELVARQKLFRENGRVDTAAALTWYQRKLDRALKRGFSGLRLHGSSGWLRISLHESGFCNYERKVHSVLTGQPVVVACSFPLMLTGAQQILDAARIHHFAVTLRKGVWKRVEITDFVGAENEASSASGQLEQLSFRQREVLQLIAEGQNTKEIAELLCVSVKTVEVHRLQLMRRLKIDNVPGLVRFAIRTGLVSAEA